MSEDGRAERGVGLGSTLFDFIQDCKLKGVFFLHLQLVREAKGTSSSVDHTAATTETQDDSTQSNSGILDHEDIADSEDAFGHETLVSYVNNE